MTHRGFYRLGILLPLVGFALAAALSDYLGLSRSAAADLGSRTDWAYPESVVRGLVAYLGVSVWAWRVIGRDPLAAAARRLWLAPLLYVILSSLLVALVAITQERGVAALSGQGAFSPSAPVRISCSATPTSRSSSGPRE